MGRRGASESVTAILLAFMRQRTWSQVELARAVGVQVPALRKHLAAMEGSGFPLEREEEHPHVYWSVPRGWFPGGVVYFGDDLDALLRSLARLPKSKERERLIQAATSCLASPTETKRLLSEIIRARPANRSDESYLSLLEDAARNRVAVRCRYYTEHSGRERWRDFSVQRIFPGQITRLVAWCHESSRLKWFRTDNVLDAVANAEREFVEAPAQEVDAFVDQSVSGYFASDPPRKISFRVREPEARWVVKNLLEGMKQEVAPDGVRIVAHTSAIAPVARFVVGLGEAATPETVELRLAVLELARGAISVSDSAQGSSHGTTAPHTAPSPNTADTSAPPAPAPQASSAPPPPPPPSPPRPAKPSAPRTRPAPRARDR